MAFKIKYERSNNIIIKISYNWDLNNSDLDEQVGSI